VLLPKNDAFYMKLERLQTFTIKTNAEGLNERTNVFHITTVTSVSNFIFNYKMEKHLSDTLQCLEMVELISGYMERLIKHF